MKAVAFSNNDIAVVAWTFGGKLNGLPGLRTSVYTSRRSGWHGDRPAGDGDISDQDRGPGQNNLRRSGAEVLLEGRVRQTRGNLQV